MLFLLSGQPSSLALEWINFKGHRKMLTDLRQAGPLCVHAFPCHQHKIRCLGSMRNCSANVGIEREKTSWCYAVKKKIRCLALISQHCSSKDLNHILETARNRETNKETTPKALLNHKVFTKFKIFALFVFIIKGEKTRVILWKLKQTIRQVQPTIFKTHTNDTTWKRNLEQLHAAGMESQPDSNPPPFPRKRGGTGVSKDRRTTPPPKKTS